MDRIFVAQHPLILSKLSAMRNEKTPSAEFRKLLHDITTLMAYETTRDLELRAASVHTPICTTQAPVLASENITIVPIIRAGLGMVEGFLELLPFAHVGHIVIQRDEETKMPREYYLKLPVDCASGKVIVVDPMLATGGSAIAALSALKDRGCLDIRMVNLVAAPEGVEAVREAHPDVDLYIASIDEGLNEKAYIVPGLGDAGDRYFNTVR